MLCLDFLIEARYPICEYGHCAAAERCSIGLNLGYERWVEACKAMAGCIHACICPQQRDLCSVWISLLRLDTRFVNTVIALQLR